jgi:hypothetical protein
MLEGPIPFWGYKEQESNLTLPEHDDDDDDDDKEMLWRKTGVRSEFILLDFKHVIFNSCFYLHLFQ